MVGLDKMNEEKIWKDIKDYEKYYEVSNAGEIRSKKTKKILKSSLRNGYQSVSLSKENIKKTINIHKVVCETFIENIENKPYINHKNGNKTDNRVLNLEWCSPKENVKHALETKLNKPSTKQVEQYSYDGKKLIATFNSIREAEEETGIGNRLISSVCRGKKNSAHGFKWKYVEPIEIIEKDDVIGKIIPDFPNYILTKDKKIYSISAKRYLTKNKQKNGMEYIKLCNNGFQKDHYINVLYRIVFEDKDN